MEYTDRHKSLAIIPHVTASLSVLGSLYIIVDVLRKPEKRSSTQHRLLLGMSVSDLLASAFLFLSTWPIPHQDDAAPYGALGNITTCNVQGFMIQLGVACPLYNAILAMYYLLVVRYGYKEYQFKKAEKFCHFFCWIFAFGTAIASWCLELYNNANLWCWIANLPYECQDSIRNGGVTTCIRGDNAWLYRLLFYYIWLWIAVIIVTVATFLMFWTVYKQAKRVQKFDFRSKQKGSQQKTAQKHVHRVAAQGILYVVAFYLTATPPSVVRMYQAKFNCTSTFYPLSLVTVLFFPTQGMWNFFIYIRPKLMSHWRIYRMSSSTSAASSRRSGRFFERIFFASSSNNNNNNRSSSATSRVTNDDLTNRGDDYTTNRDITNYDFTSNRDVLANEVEDDFDLNQQDVTTLPGATTQSRGMEDNNYFSKNSNSSLKMLELETTPNDCKDNNGEWNDQYLVETESSSSSSDPSSSAADNNNETPRSQQSPNNDNSAEPEQTITEDNDDSKNGNDVAPFFQHHDTITAREEEEKDTLVEDHSTPQQQQQQQQETIIDDDKSNDDGKVLPFLNDDDIMGKETSSEDDMYFRDDMYFM